MKKVLKSFVLALIKGYRMTAGFRRWVLPPCCRFYPTCSVYAAQATETYGAVYGVWLTLKRLARCHPLHPGGLDPVPSLFSPAAGLLSFFPLPSGPSVNQENTL